MCGMRGRRPRRCRGTRKGEGRAEDEDSYIGITDPPYSAGIQARASLVLYWHWMAAGWHWQGRREMTPGALTRALGRWSANHSTLRKYESQRHGSSRVGHEFNERMRSACSGMQCAWRFDVSPAPSAVRPGTHEIPCLLRVPSWQSTRACSIGSPSFPQCSSRLKLGPWTGTAQATAQAPHSTRITKYEAGDAGV